MRQLLFPLAGILFGVVVTLAGGLSTRDLWLPWLGYAPSNSETESHDPHHHNENRVTLTPQAQRSLQLVLRPVQPQTWTRTLRVPATVVAWPGRSEVSVTAPLGGIVTQVLAEQGRLLRPGDPLFQIRLLSDALHSSQLELFKAVRELDLVQKQRDRLAQSVASGGMPANKLLELDLQRERLLIQVQAHEQDLRARRLTMEQINEIRQGRFITALVVRAPGPGGDATLLSAAETQEPGPVPDSRIPPGEALLREIKVNVGDHVQPGQTLAVLADHSRLYLEGQAFKDEVPFIFRAARENRPVRLETSPLLPQEENNKEGVPGEPLRIEYLGAATGPGQITPFYVPLANPTSEVKRAGVAWRHWYFRPGQRLLLRVPVEEKKGVIVLPPEAVVREGLESYVFVQNGKVFDRVPVQVLYEDAYEVVLASDANLTPGTVVVRNEAAALQRLLRTQTAGEHDHHHHHH